MDDVLVFKMVELNSSILKLFKNVIKTFTYALKILVCLIFLVI